MSKIHKPVSDKLLRRVARIMNTPLTTLLKKSTGLVRPGTPLDRASP